MSLLKSIAAVSGGTAVSRIVGLVRDMLVAKYLGATLMSDAFFVAFRFPNLFRSLLAEGTLNVAFVPLLTGELHAAGKKSAREFAAAVFSFLFYVLLIFVVIIEIVMPGLMFLLAPGFGQIPGKLALTTTLSRIAFPFLMAVSLVSLMAGILNSLGKFGAAALTPTILNLCMIAGLIGLTPFIASEYAPAYALAWGVLIAGVCELAFLGYFLWKNDFTFRLLGPVRALFRLSGPVKTLLKKMGPGVLGSGVYQINLCLDTIFVSFVGAGAISWLNYANRLFQLPVGMIGVAIGTALLPVLSRHIRAGEYAQANIQLNRGLELSLAMSLASTIGLVLLATPIIGVLFEHGVFTRADTIRTADALMIYALGLPAYMTTKALSPFFYARGDTKTPVKIAICGVVLNSVAAITLMQVWGYIGIALATTIATWVNAAQYFVRVRKSRQFARDDLFRFRAPRIVVACILMGVALGVGTAAARAADPEWQFGLSLYSAGILSALVGLGVAVFTGFLMLTKVFTWEMVRSFVRRPTAAVADE
ncbi:MAG: murein biosynthesis integral membrane protein MurJ [Alphaproteobacteria bacterium]|nr:murein biosynthesis integral membrane protein MurJ [Alphaproteobacteria bacterium]